MSGPVFLVGLALMGAQPGLPDGFWRLPADVREKATLVVSGRYREGRGVCEPLPDGRSRFPMLRGFEVTAVHRGDVESNYVGVDASDGLVEGVEYLVLLRPSPASLKLLRRREGSRSHRDALRAEEVVAIVVAAPR